MTIVTIYAPDDPPLSTSRSETSLRCGLKLLYDKDDRRGVGAEHVEKTARLLARLDVVARPEQLSLPGFGLHRLEGDLAGYWSVAVRDDWRIIFRFDRGDTSDVDLVEYH